MEWVSLVSCAKVRTSVRRENENKKKKKTRRSHNSLFSIITFFAYICIWDREKQRRQASSCVPLVHTERTVKKENVRTMNGPNTHLHSNTKRNFVGFTFFSRVRFAFGCTIMARSVFSLATTLSLLLFVSGVATTIVGVPRVCVRVCVLCIKWWHRVGRYTPI